MEPFVEVIERALDTENWYAAVAVALTMPHICGRLETPNDGSRDRYVRWWNRYLLNQYTFRVGPEQREVVFLSGSDAYALRCAYMHEGRDDIAEQRAREVLSRFRFSTPLPGLAIHCNLLEDVLQLQVDIFCRQVCDGVRAWQAAEAGNEQVRANMAGLIEIVDARHALRN